MKLQIKIKDPTPPPPPPQIAVADDLRYAAGYYAGYPEVVFKVLAMFSYIESAKAYVEVHCTSCEVREIAVEGAQS